jgi:hypothetical protein
MMPERRIHLTYKYSRLTHLPSPAETGNLQNAHEPFSLITPRPSANSEILIASLATARQFFTSLVGGSGAGGIA